MRKTIIVRATLFLGLAFMGKEPLLGRPEDFLTLPSGRR
jgi:hypothetical protein